MSSSFSVIIGRGSAWIVRSLSVFTGSSSEVWKTGCSLTDFSKAIS